MESSHPFKIEYTMGGGTAVAITTGFHPSYLIVEDDETIQDRISEDTTSNEQGLH